MLHFRSRWEQSQTSRNVHVQRKVSPQTPQGLLIYLRVTDGVRQIFSQEYWVPLSDKSIRVSVVWHVSIASPSHAWAMPHLVREQATDVMQPTRGASKWCLHLVIGRSNITHVYAIWLQSRRWYFFLTAETLIITGNRLTLWPAPVSDTFCKRRVFVGCAPPTAWWLDDSGKCRLGLRLVTVPEANPD